jgi:hypothetical protein
MTTHKGRKEKKEVLLEEHDPVWIELRDLHFAEVRLLISYGIYLGIFSDLRMNVICLL